MPVTRSAKRALRKSLRKREINLFHKLRIKKAIKEVKELLSQKKVEQAKKLLPQIFSYLDKAAKKGVIKKNNASRKKSRLAKLIEKTLRES